MKTVTLKAVPQDPLTPARQALANHLIAVREAERAVALANEPLNRLDTLAADMHRLQGELAGINAAHEEAIRAWAGHGQGNPPVVPEDHGEIAAALHTAQAGYQAGQRARAGYEQKATQAAQRVQQLTSQTPALVAAVLLEELEPLLTERRKLTASLLRVDATVRAITTALRSPRFNPAGDNAGMRLAERADRMKRDGGAPVADRVGEADIDVAVAQFTTALFADATAVF